jgi:MFS family permease
LLIVHIRRVAEPVLPPDLFQNRTFNIGSAVLALAFIGMMGASVFFPMLFQMVMGISPANAGLLTVPLMVGMVLSSTINGRLMTRGGFDYKRMQVVGLVVALCAFGVLAWAVARGAGLVFIEAAIFALGAGLGLVSPNMTIVVQHALPAARRGVGTAMLSFFRSLGGLVGVAGSGAVLAQQLQGHVHAPELYRQAIATIFTLGTVATGLALFVLLLLPKQRLP